MHSFNDGMIDQLGEAFTNVTLILLLLVLLSWPLAIDPTLKEGGAVSTKGIASA
jgi:hypothetical protein